MSTSRRSILEAAAHWGSAQNPAYPIDQRLAMALAALEFFGGEYEKNEESAIATKSPSTREETSTTLVIQSLDRDDSEEFWEDETEIGLLRFGSTPQEYFNSWGKDSGFKFRLIERKTVSHITETVLSEKQE